LRISDFGFRIEETATAKKSLRDFTICTVSGTEVAEKNGAFILSPVSSQFSKTLPGSSGFGRFAVCSPLRFALLALPSSLQSLCPLKSFSGSVSSVTSVVKAVVVLVVENKSDSNLSDMWCGCGHWK
jgi:hypothetical protein